MAGAYADLQPVQRPPLRLRGRLAGLGGVFATNLVQTGEQSLCTPDGQENYAWWEVVPYDPVFLSYISYPVEAGDYMYATVTYTGGGTGNTYVMYLADISQRWDYQITCPSSDCLDPDGTPETLPSGYPATAEAIVERYFSGFSGNIGYPVPKFSPIPFSNVHYYYAGTAPAGGFRVYVEEPPKTGAPEMYVNRTLASWTVYWEHAY